MSMVLDPFTQVHDAIWAKLNASRGFTELVARGNRVNVNDEMTADGARSLEGDRPAVMIVPTGGAVDLWATSASASLSESFEVRVTTSDVRPDASLNRVKWQVLKAMSRGDDRLGLSFVTDVSFEGVRERRENTGWAAVLIVKVGMSIPRVELQG